MVTDRTPYNSTHLPAITLVVNAKPLDAEPIRDIFENNEYRKSFNDYT